LARGLILFLRTIIIRQPGPPRPGFLFAVFPISHSRIFGDSVMGRSTKRRREVLLCILAIVILIAVVAAQVNRIAMYGINNRYWPRHLVEEARIQRQKGEYIQAVGSYVRAYTLALEGETRLFLTQPIIRRVNSLGGSAQYEQALKLCRIASRLAGRHDPEGVIGSSCATLEEILAIQDCERSCSGKCNIIIDGEYACNDDS
jgi:hypothetical protein